MSTLSIFAIQNAQIIMLRVNSVGTTSACDLASIFACPQCGMRHLVYVRYLWRRHFAESTLSFQVVKEPILSFTVSSTTSPGNVSSRMVKHHVYTWFLYFCLCFFGKQQTKSQDGSHDFRHRLGHVFLCSLFVSLFSIRLAITSRIVGVRSGTQHAM